MKKNFILIVFILVSLSAAAQNEAANWYFGNQAGIDFNSGAPVALTNGQLFQLEGCATISDSLGNLLFYTSGVDVYNASHAPMLNGTDLLGDPSSSQSAIIVPSPGDDSKYFIFTVDAFGEFDGLNYSVVDMSLDGGLGGIIVDEKNIQLETPVTEKITALYHGNTEDIWVICHRVGSNKFAAYLVTAAGVTLTPVVSSTGAIHYSAGNGIGTIGYMKGSPNGKKIAVANFAGSAITQLLDFDNITGVVSNPITLNTYSTYGVEFSPDSKVLYATSSGYFASPIYQYDISLDTQAAMQASGTIIASEYNYAPLQLAIDGKIYVGTAGTTYLHVINNPNELGVACNFETQAVDLDGKYTQFGLPPFIQNYFIQEIQATQFCLGLPTLFNIKSGIDTITASWDFGDGNTSTDLEPEHQYNSAGDYTVTVDFTTAAGDDIIHLEKEITIIPSPVANDPEDMVSCDTLPNDGIANFMLTSQNSTVLGSQVPADYTIAYFLSEELAIAGEESLPVSYTNTENPQVLYARVTNNETSCYDITSFNLIVNPVPTITDPEDLMACEEEQGEGISTFDLTDAIPQISGGNTSLSINFYKIQADIPNDIPINTPELYVNTNPYNETVYFKAADPSAPDCTVTGQLGLVVNPLPNLNDDIADYILCDNNNTGDGYEIFDLAAQYSAVTNEPGLVLTYSYEQAGDLITIADPSAFQNTVANQQTIYVSTENVYTCANITSFDIVVAPFPDINEGQLFLACEDEGGQGNFHLDAITPVLTGNQLGLTVTYYETEEAAEVGGEGLDTPYLSGNTTIYARVAVTLTGCAITLPVQLEVIPSPVAEVPDPLEECDFNNDGVTFFNLDPVLQQIANEMGNVTVTIYETYDDAFYAATNNEITNTGSYTNIGEAWTQTLWIRVEANTGQNGCFDIVPLVLIVHPVPEAATPAPYEICDNGADDTDGFAIFDLTTLEQEILDGMSPADFTVTFHELETEAAEGFPAIPTPASYNSESNTIYARVTNNDTGCYDVVPVELIVNELPVANDPTPLTLCDEDPADPEVEIFDLTVKIPEIILDQEGLIVTFHFDYDEAVDNVNDILDPYNYPNDPNVETLFVRVTNAETGCYRIVLLDVRVAPLPIILEPTEDDLTVCDTDGNGIGEFNLEALRDSMINNGPDLEIAFYETAENALAGTDPMEILATYHNVVPFMQPIYVMVTNTETGCTNSTPYELMLIVEEAPQAPDLEDITMCDDTDNNNDDGQVFFDLTVQNQVIYDALNLTAADLTIHYFTNEDFAYAGAPRITVPDHFNGVNNQTIWVRVEDVTSECFSVGSFQLFVDEPLVLETPTPLKLCNTVLPNDASEVFDLTTKTEEILGPLGIGQGNIVEYFESQAAVDANTPIATPEAYTNTVNPKTIFVRVTTEEGCHSYTTLTIRVLPLPVPDTTPDPLVLCDVNDTGDDVEVFNLTDAEDGIRNNDFQSVVTYYDNIEDAEAGINPIANPEAYSSGNATIYVRVEANTTNPNDPKCYQIVELELIVTPLPTADDLIYAQCEQGTDGVMTFLLEEFVENLLGPGAADYDITFYLNQAAYNAGTTMPVVYDNISNPQNILVHIENLLTDCEALLPMQLIVEEAAFAYPVSADNNPLVECDYDGTNDGFHEFDLTTVAADVLGTQNPADYTVTYYETEEDAIAGENAITNPETYTNETVLTQTIWVRVTHTNSISQCWEVTSFQIEVELLAEPVINTPDGNNTICVDFNTQEVVRSLILDSGVIPNGQTFDWYLNGELIASNGDGFYEAMAPGLYTVIVTSANGCVSEESEAFEVIQSGPASAIGTGYYVTDAFSDEQTITVLVEGYGQYEFRLDEDGPWQTSNVFNNVAPGSHTVYVRDVLTEFGCSDLILTGVSVIDFPRFFTPNGDGYHDTWNIIGLEGQPEARIYIFDRYGKLMKQISSAGEGWDGTFNGQPAVSTDYWFTVTYSEYVGDVVVSKEFKAHFSLKR